MSFKKGARKILKSFVGVMLLLSICLSGASSANAQLVVSSPDVVTQMTVSDLLKKIVSSLKDSLISSLSAQMMNLLSMMASEMASNTATWIASGGNAEAPLYNVLPSKDYFKYAGARVLSGIYDEVVLDNFEDGMWPTLNVYINTSPEVLASIRAGIKSLAVRPEISFEYPSIKNNWASYLATLSATDLEPEIKTAQILGVIAEAFDPSVNELSAIAQVQMYALSEAQTQAQTEEESLQANDGFQAIVHYITGQVETPASMVKQELESALELQRKLPFDINSSLLANSDTLLSIGVNAGTVFTNTLFSKLMSKFQSGLLEDIVAPSNPFDEDSTVEYSRSRMQEIFRSITSFKPLEVTDYSLLSELVTCPLTFRGSSRHLFNCALDSSFASAITLSRTGNSLTLQDAIDEGYIRGEWPLIPSSDTARNQDSKCYTYGFCHSNLIKLRKARIISIGWELAAESQSNSDTNPVTLQEVIDGFYSCNSDGELDDEHPWCHLIDPNWVIEFPETQCRTLAYGQVLSAAGTDQRAQECVDIQSCISEDENGNCMGGYGSCVREKNTWQFRGDECPAEYASCMSFEGEDGNSLDFLTNTLDYGNCSASNMGCLWYGTQKDESTDGSFAWPEMLSVAVADIDPDAYKNRIYFNGEVAECEVEDAGCSAIYERDEDTTLNIFSNPSFESDNNTDGIPDGWITSGTAYSAGESEGRTGADAIDLESGLGTVSRMGIVLDQSKFYALSFYAKTGGTGTDIGSASLTIKDENGNSTNLSAQSISGSCSGDCESTCFVPTTYTDVVELDAEIMSVNEFVRFECVFTTPTLIDRSLDLYGELVLEGDIVFDDIQLEQSPDATIFTDGYNTDQLNTKYTKLAPDYLGCTGGDDDSAECDSYAQICTEQDAGCGLYIPANGDPSVTAVVSELDMCPSVCSGYDSFRQEATTYEPYGDFPIYLIPDSASSCSESAVGCTEFTNLSTEEKEYYTYLRTCVTESQASANPANNRASTYYTWEGSDEEGYQLRTWSLLESDLDASSYFNYSYDVSGETDTNPGLAPCTNWTPGATGITCVDDAQTPLMTFDTDSASCDEHLDTLTNPDCREFYDAGGAIHYRLWSETVTVNDACGSYRLTELAGESAVEWEATCESANGYYDSTANICRFYGYSDESDECSESENGCRSYTGGRSGNSRIAFEAMFEGGSLSAWDASSASRVTLSNESVAFGGHSLKSESEVVWTYAYDNSSACAVEDGCDSTTGVLGGSCTLESGEQYCGTLQNQFYTNKTYTLSFWAKGEVNILAGIDERALLPDVAADAYEEVELDSEWRYYSVGPFDMNEIDYPNFENGSVLVFEPNSGSGDFYIDNISLREGEDNITLIRDSWTTPLSCDSSFEGAISPQEHLGCQEYTDQNEDIWYLKSFRDLCSDDKVGCDAYYTTTQSESEYSALYNATCYNIDATGGAWAQADNTTARSTCYLYTSADGTSFDTTSPALCTIIAGEDNCKFDLEGWFLPQSDIGIGADDQRLYHIAYGPDTTFVEPDRSAYIVYDEELACASEVAGCTQLGKPTFSRDLSTVLEWEDSYLIDDPDLYDTILCDDDELFCKEWDTQENGTWYFKDPIDHTCEYKTDVSISGTSYSGWFQEGTSEFCYGTGVCSEDSTIACEKDAECGLAGAGECLIRQGSYLIGGDQSGIWRNGDTEYDGWVGHCSAQYNLCTEFEDTLDVDDDEFYGSADGEMYHFIDNEQLEDSSLLSSQRCDGEVSQKEGCVLFHNSGDTDLDYNASATYTVSAHADELIGESKNSLVDPVDCSSSTTSTITLSDGSTFDPCESRCVYENEELEIGSASNWSQRNSSDITDYSASYGSTCSSNSDCTSGQCNTYAGYCSRALTYTADEIYTVGQSCYEDIDCPSYEGSSGDIVKGSCETQLFLASMGPSSYLYDDVDRLENDSNRVLSVNQNRVCSEWLSCSSSYSIWDQDAGKYRTICDGVDLCTEYSAEGHPSFCSQWDSNDSAVVLDTERYVARDVSFYGEEYSGYAVPDLFPLQHLEQVDVAPPAGYCDLSDRYEPDDTQYIDFHGNACDSDTECVSGVYIIPSIEGLCVQEQTEDYRLGYIAGSCDDNYAEDCSIGYCSDNGSACTEDGDCESADAVCATGMCYAISTTSCSVDEDCSSNQECLSGVCVEQGDYCDMDQTCATGETCFVSQAAKDGGCYNGSCFLAMDGEPFNDARYEGQVCRANPEANSPFGNNVVSQWKYLEDSTELTDSNDFTVADIVSSSSVGGIVASTRLSGFDQVELCEAGEDCVCSYTKLETKTGMKAYISASTDRASLGVEGICDAASNVAGSLCYEDLDCGPEGGAEGKCVPIVGENTLYGLTGYCLERDTGLSIEGDQYKGACLTWFPVDQLAGSTDLYAKYATAGYNDDEYYCGYTSMFTDFYTTGSTQSSDSYPYSDYPTACAETEGSATCGGLNCVDNAACPDGYYAIMGECGPNGDEAEWGDNYASACLDGNNDCPYVCVPYNSHIEGDVSVSCDPDSVEDDTEINLTHTGSASFGSSPYAYSNRVYTVNGFDDFDTVVDYIHSCVVNAVENGSTEFNDLIYKNRSYCSGTTCSADSSARGYDGFYNLYLSSFTYPACSVLLQTADVADGNYAWTDRILGSQGYEITGLEYNASSENQPFGASLSPDYLNNNDISRIPACQITQTTVIPDIPYDGLCSGTDYGLNVSFDEPGALPYTSFIIDIGSSPELEPYRASIDFEDETSSTLIPRLNEIFAKVTRVFGWDSAIDLSAESQGNIGEYVEIELGYDTAYDTDVRSSGVAPTVWAVDTEHCGSVYCEEGTEGAITLNNQDQGDFQSDEGFFRATLKFFAGAYKEQLPIRRVIIDWGDGDLSGSSDPENYYKNHRGLVEDSLTESKCDTGDEWGMTTDSCDPNYFTYQHAYRCTDASDYSACSLGTDGVPTNMPCSMDNNTCVFQPRVHVRDNWGWCTGSCGSEGEDGCFDYVGDLSGTLSGNFCDYTNTANDAWVDYDGVIYVTED